jgi:transposase
VNAIGLTPTAHKRKNWLFSQSQAGVEASAAIYLLIETAMRSGHEPWHYLTHVLTELPTTKPDDLQDLLPHNMPAITFH